MGLFVPIQLVLSLFLLFALSRVVLRLKDGNLTVGEFMFWFGVFTFALVGVIEPSFTNFVARKMGIGRGADVVLYASVAVLFYMIFRTNIMLENVRNEVTQLVRMIALSSAAKKNPVAKSKRK